MIVFYLHLKPHNANYYMQVGMFWGYPKWLYTDIYGCFDSQIHYDLGTEVVHVISVGEM